MLPQTTELLGLMQQASGFTPDEILGGCRKIPLPACRWFIGAELMDMGFTSMMAARELNIDHATLLHGRKQINAITERNGWRADVQIYVQFKKLVNANRKEVVQPGNT